MQTITSFPASFPNQEETRFLQMVLASDEKFPTLFEAWSREVVLDDVDYATMRLLPLVYMRLSKLGIKGPLFGRIQGVYKLAWVKNQQLMHTLESVAAACAKNGIRMMVVKGVPLLVLAYKNIGARFLDDADILIDTADISKTFTLLAETGWKNTTDYFPVVEYFTETSLARITKEATFKHKEYRGVIDLHWRLFELPGVEQDAKEIPYQTRLSNALRFMYKNSTYHTMAAEELLLHVVVHGGESNLHRTLRWVTDAAAIIRELPIDWNIFLVHVSKAGWGAEVKTAFAYMIEHKLVDIPKHVEAVLAGLEISPKEFNYYYKKANGVKGVFDGFTVLWKTYWTYEVKNVFPGSWYWFLVYVGRARGFTTVKQLAKFVGGKILKAPEKMWNTFSQKKQLT